MGPMDCPSLLGGFTQTLLISEDLFLFLDVHAACVLLFVTVLSTENLFSLLHLVTILCGRYYYRHRFTNGEIEAQGSH